MVAKHARLKRLERRRRIKENQVIAVRDIIDPGYYWVNGEHLTVAEFEKRYPDNGETIYISVIHESSPGEPKEEPWWLNI